MFTKTNLRLQVDKVVIQYLSFQVMALYQFRKRIEVIADGLLHLGVKGTNNLGHLSLELTAYRRKRLDQDAKEVVEQQFRTTVTDEIYQCVLLACDTLQHLMEHRQEEAACGQSMFLTEGINVTGGHIDIDNTLLTFAICL